MIPFPLPGVHDTRSAPTLVALPSVATCASANPSIQVPALPTLSCASDQPVRSAQGQTCTLQTTCLRDVQTSQRGSCKPSTFSFEREYNSLCFETNVHRLFETGSHGPFALERPVGRPRGL